MNMTAQTVLLAEWDTLLREQVRDLLTNESCRVIEAETGPQPQYLKTAWGKGYRFEVSRHRTKA